MDIQITGRHMAVTDAMRDYLTEKLGAVLSGNTQIESAHAILDVQKINHVAEVIIQGRRNLRIEARAISTDMYKSIDCVADKVDRQIKRVRERRAAHKMPGKRVRLSDFERQASSVDEG